MERYDLCYDSLGTMTNDLNGASPSREGAEAALQQESRFWGTVTRLLLDSGVIPYDVDRRRAARIRSSDVLRKLGSRRADPQIEDHWRGGFTDQTLAPLAKK